MSDNEVIANLAKCPQEHAQAEAPKQLALSKGLELTDGDVEIFDFTGAYVSMWHSAEQKD